MSKLVETRRALSPVVAAIILIAVTVAVSIAVAAWMGGLTFTFMKVEEFKVIDHTWASDISYIDLTVKNIGTEPIVLGEVRINNELPNTLVYISGSATLNKGGSATLRVTHNFTSGRKYEFWLVSTSGTKYPFLTTAPFVPSQTWNHNYSYYRQITITNNLESPLGYGYSVNVTMDTTLLVSAGKMRSDGNDLRIVYWNSTTAGWLEVDRHVIAINSASTQVWFKTQKDIAPLSSDYTYYVYYGNPSAGSPPANRKNVYLWFDDFNRADNPDITTEAAYSVKTGGGTWSIETNKLKNVGAAGDPNKLIITALGTVNADIEMLVKINVTSFAGGDYSRMGLSCCMDTSPSRGSGYCGLFHDDTGSLDLLNDLRSWGTRGTYSWSLDTCYYMRFRVIDPASKLGKIRVWQVGTTEPNTWTVDGNFGGGTARGYGEVGFGGSRTTDTTYFDDILIRRIADPEPSTSVGQEKS
jgi:flagellin-like protein